ncbi:TonB-dependent receptor plug domain-containing protein [Brevundimonas lenta]|uniref:Outer membrane receptor protein involved in Fe transport n=1 Tax=Brevundimonas lenta TaxID=424796 RepID=A0A7W6JA03_9CAUL|nr:TonB-dependent receptor [Brevundimonas lenta]MBB4081263.1 outer membrane receptor protein involved in Fe transport [Brevundimonas lenta]
MKLGLLLGAALAPLAFAGAVCAQDATPAGEYGGEPVQIEDVIVNGEIVFRNRTTDDNPVLSYDLEYFQRFEPVSVGEMLKRVPGVTFTSDVLEFDGVSMRGLPPGYTSILINGRRAPGGEDDGAFFVDRIPAELVERIEIIRSPRADQPSDGVAGAINIVLKEGAQLEGGSVRAGALINEDGEVRGAGSLTWAGNTENTSLWAALNYQGRRNPKQKRSERYDDDPANGGELDNIELQDDTRDGVDMSANAEFTTRFDNGRLRFNGLVIDTDRDEDETSVTYVDDGSGSFTEIDGVEIQQERISQQTYALGMDGAFDVGPGELDFKLGWTGFRDDTTATTFEGDNFQDPDLALVEDEETLEITDDELDFGGAYTLQTGNVEVKFGADFLNKQRDGVGAEGVDYAIEENRFEPYVRVSGEIGATVRFDAGLRYESSEREVTGDLGTVESDASDFFPSAHLTWSPTQADQFRASYARTQRRPNFSYLAPIFQDEEPADEDGLRGNPLLESEKANGFDVGYERRIGTRGIFGVNVFYREIEDLIEVVDTGLEVNEDGETPAPGDDVFNLFEPRNIGDGTTWGIEFDFSSPLDVIGLPDTGLFFNYTWMDSEVTDPWTGDKRPFRNQPQNVYNVGFIHTVNSWDMSFGASIYGRDEGYESGMDELVKVEYDQDLEAFIEKRFGDRVVVRLSAMNLLDKEKRETFWKYDGDSVEEILDNRANGDIDEFELESERSGVLYQVTLRAAF